MRTRIQSIIQKHNDSIKDLQRIMGISHTQDEFSGFIKGLGGEVEKFLKESVYHNTRNHDNFMALIDNLTQYQVNTTSIQFLHDLRLLYNKLKHEPLFSTTILICIETLQKSLIVMQEIELINMGAINDPYSQTESRIVWLAGWDDYIGGMTEISIFLPDYELDFPIAIEHFNIDWKGWELIKDNFTLSGELMMGQEYVSEIAYKRWEGESDFLGAGRFTGDIQDLIKFISAHIDIQKEEELLECLKRKNNSASVKAAIVFSLLDSFSDNTWNNFDDLIDEIKIRSSYDYGILIDSKTIDKYISYLNREIESTERTIFSSITGIKWLDEQRYNREQIQFNLIRGSNIAINSDNQIICRIK